jgi:predicted PurR-regulated permease PerM
MSEFRHQSRISSPPWQSGTRIIVALLVLALLIFILVLLRSLILPILSAFIIAYLLHPIANWLNRRGRIPRGIAAFLVLLLFLVVIVGMTTGVGFAFSDRIVALAVFLADIAQQLPAQIEQLSQIQFAIGPFEIDLGQSNLTPVLSDVVSSISPLLAEAGSFISSIALAAASAVSTFLLVLVISFYLILDFEKISPAVIRLAPPAYREDVRYLLDETDSIWRAFLRGQLLLGVIIGVTTAILMIIVGLEFPLTMGLIAGVMELVPMVGPFVSALVGSLLALFQAGNIWGLSPLAYAAIIVAIFTALQQFESVFLVPRVIGGSLQLPPLLVFLAVLAGGIIGGLIGVLLAAPTLATLRLYLGYVYSKIVDLEGLPGPALEPREPSPRLTRMRTSFLDWWRRFRQEEEMEDE